MIMKIVHPAEQSGAAVKSAARVLDILELMAGAPMPLGVSEIARRLGMPKSSTHLLLSTLAARGYLVADLERRFALNPLMVGAQRAWVGGFIRPMLRVARPLMRELSDRTGESALLGRMRDPHTLEYIEKAVSRDPLRVDPELGVPRPLHSTSTGQVLLAYAPESTLQACLAGLAATLDAQAVETLEQTLATVRTQGFAMISDPASTYAFGVAVPIRDASGEVVAALNVSAPAARFHAAREHVIRELVSVASSINEHLTRAANGYGSPLSPEPARTAPRHPSSTPVGRTPPTQETQP